MALSRAKDPDKNRKAVRKWKRENPAAKNQMDRKYRRKGTWREGLSESQVCEAIELHKARRALLLILETVAGQRAREPQFCWIWNRPRMGAAWKFRTRYRLDHEFALTQRLRSAARRLIRRDKVGDLVRSAICRGGRSPSAEAMLGYPVSHLKDHLERQFVRGMSWQAFGRGEIHIDHIIPLASFDLSDEGEWRAAWSLSNLQPLWATDNLIKGSKVRHLL